VNWEQVVLPWEILCYLQVPVLIQVKSFSDLMSFSYISQCVRRTPFLVSFEEIFVHSYLKRQQGTNVQKASATLLLHQWNSCEIWLLSWKLFDAGCRNIPVIGALLVTLALGLSLFSVPFVFWSVHSSVCNDKCQCGVQWYSDLPDGLSMVG
jgi:hypothetical protein